MSFTRLHSVPGRRGAQGRGRGRRTRSSPWRGRRARWRVRPRELRAHTAPGEVVPAQAVLRGAGPGQAPAPALPHRHDLRDLASARVREAGGPIDEASYTCACGCVFLAPVSTTVGCPHCGATQAW